jgi:DNA-binding XRE family transcriptional regulator
MKQKSKKIQAIPLKEFIKKQNYSDETLARIDSKARYYKSLNVLRETRKQIGMTQEELSVKAGIPRSTLSNIESGKRNVTIERLIMLASAMGKTLVIKFSEI